MNRVFRQKGPRWPVVACASLIAAAATGAQTLYVDALGSGDGSSPSSPLPTIRAALDRAAAGDTILVRGGDGRAYSIASDADTLQIGPGLDGLSIRAWGESPADGVRAAVAISKTFIEDGNTLNIISNASARVTISGLEFSFGKNSLGKQDVGNNKLFWTDAPSSTFENCVFRMDAPCAFGGSVAGNPIILCGTTDATNLVVRGCEFYNVRVTDPSKWQSVPIKYMGSAQIVGNVFSNVCAIILPQQKDWRVSGDKSSGDLLLASNLVYGAHNTGNYTGTLQCVYPGPKSAEIAYNRFVVDPGAGLDHYAWIAMGGSDGYGKAVSWSDATLIHHNTFIGGKVVLRNAVSGSSSLKMRFCDNLVVLDEGGTNYVENATSIKANQTSGLVAPSVLRRNACLADEFNGGTATEVAGYDLSPFLADNIVLDAAPEFICTNDIYSADFYRIRQRLTATGVNWARDGWAGAAGTWPRFIGALPPLTVGGLTIRLR